MSHNHEAIQPYIPVKTEKFGGYLGQHERNAIAQVLAERAPLTPLKNKLTEPSNIQLPKVATRTLSLRGISALLVTLGF